MSANPRTEGPARDDGSGTLGGLLYAKARVLVSEEDWVAVVRALASGDQAALRELYRRTYRLVFTLVLRIVADRATAEELTLDVFHEAWRRASRYDPADGTVLGWIMNLARSRAIDRVRFEHRKKRVSPAAHEPADARCTSGSEEALLQADRGRFLRNALSALAPEERRAIETAYFGELTYAETATRLNEPLGTVKTRIRSGLAKLRIALEGAAGS